MPEEQGEWGRMLRGEPYRPDDPRLVAARRRAKALCHAYNQRVVELDRDTLAELLGAPTDAHLEPPFLCDYGLHLALGPWAPAFAGVTN